MPRIGKRLIIAALSLVGAGLSSTPLLAKGPGPLTSNEQIVANFFVSGNNPDQAASFFADEGKAYMEEGAAPVVGKKAIADSFRAITSGGTTITAKIISSYAAGPIVVNQRVDTMTIPGQPTQTFNLVGVLVLRDGKILEWRDYPAE